MIKSILDTDMAKHAEEIANFKNLAPSYTFEPKNEKDKNTILSYMFHVSDISASTKPWEVCFPWVELLF